MTQPYAPGGPDEKVGRDGLLVLAIAGAVLAVVIAVVGVGFGMRAIDEAEGAEGSAFASGEPYTVDVELGDLYVEPSSIEVPAGSEVVVNVTNAGEMAHDLKLDGETGTELLDPGASATASLGVVTETSEAWCTVPGHKEGGMVLDIEVTGSASGGSGAATAGSPQASGAEIDFAAEPADDF